MRHVVVSRGLPQRFFVSVSYIGPRGSPRRAQSRGGRSAAAVYERPTAADEPNATRRRRTKSEKDPP